MKLDNLQEEVVGMMSEAERRACPERSRWVEGCLKVSWCNHLLID